MDEKKTMNKQQLQEREGNIIQLAATFCNEYLDEECATLCTQLVQKLGHQHPCLFESGRLEIWAAASVYTICSINLLFDRRKSVSLSSSDICNYFGPSHSTITRKMREIKEQLKIDPVFDSEFILRREANRHPFNRHLNTGSLFSVKRIINSMKGHYHE